MLLPGTIVAAEEPRHRWDPNSYYWPKGVPRDITIEAFIQAYEALGFRVCDGPELEPGFQKIAIYVDQDGDPSHAARQLENGTWTSKIGDHEEIEHINLECLFGPCYGQAVRTYMKRVRQGPDHPPAS